MELRHKAINGVGREGGGGELGEEIATNFYKFHRLFRKNQVAFTLVPPLYTLNHVPLKKVVTSLQPNLLDYLGVKENEEKK